MEEATHAPHQFDPKLAKRYSINAAIIYQYVWYRSVKMANGGWVALTLDDICKQYTYMGRKQVRLALKILVNPGKRNPALLARKRIGKAAAFVYQPNDKAEGTGFIRFDTQVATELGVVAAIIHNNMAFWIKDNWEKKAEELSQCVDPEKFDYDAIQVRYFAYHSTRKAAARSVTVQKMARVCPYIPLRTVERAFSCLRKAGLLVNLSQNVRNPVWTIQRKMLASFMRQAVGCNDLRDCVAKMTPSPPKGHADRQKGTLTAKRAPELPISPSGLDGCASVRKLIDEASLASRSARALKLIDKANDSLLSGAESKLFDAPSVLPQTTTVDVNFDDDTEERNREPEEDHDEVESNRIILPQEYTENYRRATQEPDIVKTMRLLNRPELPVIKKKLAKDSFGNLTKRKYHRKPKPDDEDFDLYVDDLTPEARYDYLASLR